MSTSVAVTVVGVQRISRNDTMEEALLPIKVPERLTIGGEPLRQYLLSALEEAIEEGGVDEGYHEYYYDPDYLGPDSCFYRIR